MPWLQCGSSATRPSIDADFAALCVICPVTVPQEKKLYTSAYQEENWQVVVPLSVAYREVSAVLGTPLFRAQQTTKCARLTIRYILPRRMHGHKLLVWNRVVSTCTFTAPQQLPCRSVRSYLTLIFLASCDLQMSE